MRLMVSDNKVLIRISSYENVTGGLKMTVSGLGLLT
jgi:hypothetical protein